MTLPPLSSSVLNTPSDDSVIPEAAQPQAPPPPPPPPPPEPVRFPVNWLLEHAAAPIKYRAVGEVVRAHEAAAELSSLPLTYPPALLLAAMQSPDGSWNHSMLGTPSGRAEHFEGVGTIQAVRRLSEYGWDKDTPPLHHARRLLFRLLAEDEDPDYLYDLGGRQTLGDEDLTRRGRAILREAAAATLAQAGYEGDPRLRGAAKRILERINAFLRSPLAQKPFVRVANQHVLAAEAAPPSIYALQMLAYMPLFRTENHEAMDRIYHHLAQPLPRQEAVQLCGKTIIAQPHLVLGDMLSTRNAADNDVAFTVMWLELVARLGFLKRNEGWTRFFDRMLDDRDASGIWHPHKGMGTVRSTNPFVWPMYPLEEDLDGDGRWTDVTFRLGLIARYAGRPIEPV